MFTIESLIAALEKVGNLTGANIVFVDDRGNLSFEKNFKKLRKDFCPSFTDEELEARGNDIFQIIVPGIGHMSPKDDLFKAYVHSIIKPVAWSANTSQNAPWPEGIAAFAQKLVGASFRDFKEGSIKIAQSVIFPDSPCMSGKDYWAANSGISDTVKSERTIDDLSDLHEIGHVLFPYSPEDKKDQRVAYLSEVLPDGFAVRTFLDAGGEKFAVQDWIGARRISAFIGRTPESHWTAHACEAMRDNKPVPSFSEVFGPMRELQARVICDLNGIDTSSLDGKTLQKTYDKFYEYSVGNEKKKESIWLVPNNLILFKEFGKLPTSVVMESLKKVLDKSEHLSEDVRLEGKSVLAAYKNFCCLEIKEAARPQINDQNRVQAPKQTPSAVPV